MQLPSPPEMINIRQQFPSQRVSDVEAEVREQLRAGHVGIPAGAEIALAVGSRGITHLPLIVREVARWVSAQGGRPFVVPAMGSHGGATAEGQKKVLEEYGITEAFTGAPIRSSMEVIELPRGDLEIPLFFDALAAKAAGTIVINRIKPHTSFHGPYESGLMKMIVVGLGKHAQALAIHALRIRGLREVMPEAARRILRTGKILLGVAIVENAYDETLLVRAIRGEQIPTAEPALLELARRNLPGLPVDRLDVLIIDEMGKNISGLGMDPNVIGRLKIPEQPEPERPKIGIIYVRDLTAKSHGNAVGVGLADIISRRLFEKIDLKATYANALTATFLERAKLPLIAEDDREALGIALRAALPAGTANARVVRIRNTLRMDQLQVSPAVLAELKDHAEIEVVGPVEGLFDGDGMFHPLAESSA